MPGAAAHTDDDLVDRFDEIMRRLEMAYGPRPFAANGDPVRQLVATILSQSTTDHNSSMAMASLLDAFPTWDEVIDAPTVDVATAIQAGGLAQQKAPRIQEALRSLGAMEVSGHNLAAMPVDEAMAWLTSLNGVGAKTAACVLLFALGQPIMPVDTHIARVMTRLGIVPDRTSTVTKQTILTDLIGPHAPTICAVHVETIEHGRVVCQARRPRCWACPLQDLCDYYQQHVVSSDQEGLKT
jgi:endonuclease-3